MKRQQENFDARAMRDRLDVNQHDFWGAIGVTQSGGSRYENERRMPKPVAELVRLHYDLGIDTRKINDRNAAAIRAILSGEMDAEALLSRADQARALIASLDQVATNASALARHA